MKFTVPIKGMHCRSCELLIEDSLKEIPGVSGVRVSLKEKAAFVDSAKHIDREVLKAAVEKAGYEIGTDEKKSWFSTDKKDYRDLLDCLVLLLAILFLVNKFGLLDIDTGSFGSQTSLFVVLLVGLTAGFSTCMAMVGGLVLGISARHADKHPEATPMQKFRPHVFFNIGRIASYFLLGGLIGLVGKAFQLSGPVLGIVTIAVGVIMLFLGAQLTQIFPRLSNGGITLPSSIGKIFGLKKRHEKEYSHWNSAVTGALTFFLPCGFTQAMQLYAMSSGSFAAGAIIMGTFALGTAPGLLGIGGLTSFLKGAFANKFFKFTGVLVIFLALFNIQNGYNLTGLPKPNFFAFAGESGKKSPNNSAYEYENGVRILRMDQLGGGYEPNIFYLEKGVPVKWVINSKSRSCASDLMSSKLKIRKLLQPGENIIEFTPNETGEVRFSCSMGMYNGKFIVTEAGQLPSPESFGADREDVKSQAIAAAPAGAQILRTVFRSPYDDIYPNEFTATAGKPVRFEVDVLQDGRGCMSTIMIPGLVDEPVLLEKGKKVAFDFTPSKGEYYITCAMGVPRGVITVN